jgi:hypothetical protein
MKKSKHLYLVIVYMFVLGSALTIHARSALFDTPVGDKPFIQAISLPVLPGISDPIFVEQAEQTEPPEAQLHIEENPASKDAIEEPPPPDKATPQAQVQTVSPSLPSSAVEKKDLPALTEPAAPSEPKIEEKAPAEPPAVSDKTIYDTDLNSYVQGVIATYQGRSFPYLLNNDYANYNGVTENLSYGGRVLAKAHPSGSRASHCVGLTFEVFFKAMQERNRKLGLAIDDFNGMSANDLQDFLLIWYVASGNKRISNIEVAVEKYGLGKRISRFEDAKRGDFMDFSRSNGTGHTVVFQNWVRDNGNITGVYYWSTQGSTNGIAYNTEYFDTSGRGNVLSNQVYIARVLPVLQYR